MEEQRWDILEVDRELSCSPGAMVDMLQSLAFQDFKLVLGSQLEVAEKSLTIRDATSSIEDVRFTQGMIKALRGALDLPDAIIQDLEVSVNGPE